MKVRDVKASAALSRSRLPGLDFALNPYRGCGHGCVYCYAADVLREKRQWGSFVDVKVNLPVLLSKQRKKLSGVIGLGTVTDPYQPVEEERRLTRYCLEQLARADCTVCIQTKSDLVLGDLDILKTLKNVEVGFTVTTMDSELAGKLEPGAPEPARRIAALRELSEAKIKTWVFLGPVIPGLNDSEGSLARVLEAVADSGAERLLYDRLRLKPIVRERMIKLLGDEGLRMLDTGAWQSGITKTLPELCAEKELSCESAF